MNQSFGNWVKHRRKALDLTQQALAKQVGCSVSLIFKIEMDERRPSRQVAELLAQRLEIPTDQLPLFLKIARQEKGIQNLDALPPLSTPQPATASNPLKSKPPVPPTPLIGREHEVEMVVQQLQDPGCRLLTLTGPGGVGKTRLALEVIQKMDDVFEQGAYFVPLVGTSSPEFILPTVASALDITLSGTSELKKQLLNFLQGKSILLVLDNLEHLLNDVSLISEILEKCPEIKILTTSREQLNLRAEWAFAVQGLPIPTNISLENLGSNSAVALFMQRAKHAKLDFTLTPEDLPAVENICQLVEGLPLGLELAATWVRTLSCREIAQEIAKNIDFLTATARDVPQRHRSMRAVFDYSWGLISDDEKQALMKLSVFRGGFTREAAGPVAGASLLILSALVDKSLVQYTADQRYELHELIRQYAHEQSVKAGILDETRERHFEFFLELAETSRIKLRSPEQLGWMTLLDNDYDNLRAALEWSLRYAASTESISEEREKTIQASYRMAGALYMFWRMRSHWTEGRRWLQRILDQPVRQMFTHERARALNTAALLAAEQGDLQTAHQSSDQNLEVSQRLNDPHILARAHHTHGIVLWKQKDYSGAHEHGAQAVQMFRELGNQTALAGSLQALARIAINQNKLEQAQTYLAECIAIFRELDNSLEFNASLSDQGLIYYLNMDFSTARSYHEKTLKFFREAENVPGLVEMSLNRLGDVARVENKYEEAEKLYTECLTIYRETGDKDEIASLLHNLGYIAQHRNDPVGAISRFKEALTLQRDLDNTAGIAECLAGIAGVLTDMGQAERAANLFGTAEALRESMGVVLWPANQIEYDRNLAHLREALDSNALAKAWAQGRTTSAEQAIAQTSQ